MFASSSLFSLGLAVLAGRNDGRPQHRLTVWLGLVMLGSLQAPYAATYVLVTVTLLLLVLTAEVRSLRGVMAFVGTWALFSIFPPGLHMKVAIAVSLVRMAALYAFLVWMVLRRESAVLDEVNAST